jgi:hypothetical protein
MDTAGIIGLILGGAATGRQGSSVVKSVGQPSPTTSRTVFMSIAKVRQPEEQWIELPEPNLDRYMLRSCSRAANDNRRPSGEIFRVVQIGACVVLIGATTLISALI